MENDALKFRVFIPVENGYMDNKIDNPIIDSSGNLMWCYLDKIGNLKRYEHNLLNRERAVIERCTGLKDKNGKLVYEGDILNDGEEICVVAWDEECYILEYPDGSIGEFALWCKRFAVIGTIHDEQFRDVAKLISGEKE